MMLEHESGVVGTLLTVFNGVRGREERRIEVFFESGAVEMTTDFIVGAAEDSFSSSARTTPQSVPTSLRYVRTHFAAWASKAGFPLLHVRRGSGVGERGQETGDRSTRLRGRPPCPPLGRWRLPLRGRRAYPFCL